MAMDVMNFISRDKINVPNKKKIFKKFIPAFFYDARIINVDNGLLF